MSTTGDGSPSADAARESADQRSQNDPSGSDTSMREGALARTSRRRDLAGAAARARAVTQSPDSPDRTTRIDGASLEQARQAAAAGTRPAPAQGNPAASGPRPPETVRAARGPEGSLARTSAKKATPKRARRPARRSGPRRVRLTLQRIDPWSVMKISFLVAVALGIAGVIMVGILWSVLSGMNVFVTVNDLINEITTGEAGNASFDLMEYVGFGRVISLAVVLGVANVILLTALATLTAFLYNVCTALVGGAQLTLSDE